MSAAPIDPPERPERHLQAVNSDWSGRTMADEAAEMIVLGMMMASARSVEDAAEILSTRDFYQPKHGSIYATIISLWAGNEPTAADAVARKLDEFEELERVGGAPYLHTLVAKVPTAAGTAAYWARIVLDWAKRRRMREAGLLVVQTAQDVARPIDEVVDTAQRSIHEATVSHQTGTLAAFATFHDEEIDYLEEVMNGNVPQGLTTGLGSLDDLLGGFLPGQLIIPAGRPGMGKALSLDTPLPTPSGWTTMGEVQVGDHLIGADGKPTRVIAATDVMQGRPCYEVEFSDGTVIVADAQHQWFTDTRASRRYKTVAGSVKTTEEIARTLRCGTADARINHSVPVARPFQLPQADLPIDPYTLGVWLGDGSSADGRITSADPEIPLMIEAAGYSVNKQSGPYLYGVAGLARLLRASGLRNNKHIPADYLRASEDQRRALLAGLLDTDGSIANHGKSVRFEVCHKPLADGAHELILSLGYRCVMTTKRVPGRSEASSTSYRLTFSPNEKVFQLTRKLARQTLSQTCRSTHRYITEVRPIPSVPVRCVEIDNADHLYLAGRSCIPTHNSTCGLGFAVAAARRGRPAIIHSLEMSRRELTWRLLSAVGGINLTSFTSGKLTRDEHDKAKRTAKLIAEWPLHIDDQSNTVADIRSSARRFRQRYDDLAIVFVDYLQRMRATQKFDRRDLEVGRHASELKTLAQELGTTMVVPSQLNRGPETRSDKRPQLSDMRDSGEIEQEADVVILLHRDDYYDKECARAGEADFIVAKQRNGPTDTVTVAAQLHLSRFVDFGVTDEPNYS